MTTRLAATAIPKTFPVRPLKPSDKAEDRATCGTCGLSWDDAIPTSMTPAPSARCPFEGFHHAAPVPSEQVEPRFKVGQKVFWNDPDGGICSDYATITYIRGDGDPDYWEDQIFVLQTDRGSEVEAVMSELSEHAPSEQEVTPEHSPLPWDLQIGERCCFHSGNRVALTVWHGLDTEEPTNETIAEFWPASNDLDIKDAKFVLEAVNSHAELKERVRSLEASVDEALLWLENPTTDDEKEAYAILRAALSKEKQ